MPYDTLDGYANIDPEDDDLLRELFLTPEVKERLEQVAPAARADAERAYLEGVRQFLSELSNDPRNLGDGGVAPAQLHIRIPFTDRYFFSIKQSLLSLSTTVLPAAVVTVLLPPLIILKLAPSVVSAGKAVWDAAAVLNSDSDRDVYTAVSRAIERTKLHTLDGYGATLEEIEESFKRDDKLLRPRNLSDKLSDLCTRHVLEKDTSGPVTQYFKKL